MVCKRIGVNLVLHNFVLIKYILAGGGLHPPQNKGRSKRTEGRTALKCRDGVWQWIASFKEAVPPPPFRAYVGYI